MFVDTHSHMFADAFREDIDDCIKRALQAQVTKIVLPNIDLETAPTMLRLSEKYPQQCYPAIGLHPTDVSTDYSKILQEMETQYLQTSQLDKIVAIGETGLDYYWDMTYVEQQKASLTAHLTWADIYSLPIILHTRESTRDTIDLIKSHPAQGLRGVFHCFSGTESEAQEVLDLGFYIGIGGTLTYKKNEIRNWIQNIPLDSIVLETDSPYLTPVPYRGKRNESSYIPLIAADLSQLLDASVEEIAATTTDNAHRLFSKIGEL